MSEIVPAELEHRSLTRTCWQVRLGREDVVGEFFSGPLQLSRAFCVGVVICGALLLVKAALSDGSLFTFSGSLGRVIDTTAGSLMVAAAGLAVLRDTRRIELRLEVRGKLRVTTRRALGRPRTQEFPRSALVLLEQFPIVKGGRPYWKLVVIHRGDEATLASGPMPPPGPLVAHAKALGASVERVGSLGETE